MQLFATWIPDWMIYVGALLTLLYWYMRWNFGYWESRGVPCPPPILFFGNLLTERNKVMRDEDIRKSKLYGPVYGFYEGRKPTLRVTDPDMLREILSKQFEHFTDRRKIDLGNSDPVIKKFLTLVNGTEWREIRHVMTPTFTSGRLKQMGPLIEEAVGELADILKEKSESKSSVDLKRQFGPLVMDIIATCAFGMRINSQKNPDTPFVKYASELLSRRNVFKMFLLIMLPTFIRNFFNLTPGLNRHSIEFFKNAIKEVIRSRQENNVIRHDFLQLMIEAQIEGHRDDSSNLLSNAPKPDPKKVLTPDGVVAQSVLFLLAGFETISTALSIVCYQLALNEDIQQTLSNEIDQAFLKNNGSISYETLFSMQYLDMVLMESLRWFPPGFRTERECVHDTKLGDLTIKKGTLISIPIHAIHWDEKNYQNPEKFDPERFNTENRKSINQYAYLPFGIGPRNCIGMRFALMEAKYILVHLIHKFRLSRCPETKIPLVISPKVGTLTSEAGAWVRFEKKE